MKKMINKTHNEGLLYDHKLAEKVSGPDSKNPGTPYINGTIDLLTDEAGLNIVSVFFPYVTEKTAKGGNNATYAVLKSIIDGVVKTVMKDGKENASKLRSDSAINLNEFYDRTDALVSYERNEGGFIHLTDKLNVDEGARATFEVDIVITNVIRNEVNPDMNTPETLSVKGAIFDFRNSLLPIELKVFNPKGMDYFEALEASPSTPVFTKVWGRQISQTVTTERVEENAFGEPKVIISERKNRALAITGAAVDSYVWDSEDSITAAELKKCMEDREIKLAGLKKQHEEYQAQSQKTVSTPPTGNFSF